MRADWPFGLGAVALVVIVWLLAQGAKRAFPGAYRVVNTAAWIFEALWLALFASVVIYRLVSGS